MFFQRKSSTSSQHRLGQLYETTLLAFPAYRSLLVLLRLGCRHGSSPQGEMEVNTAPERRMSDHELLPVAAAVILIPFGLCTFEILCSKLFFWKVQKCHISFYTSCPTAYDYDFHNGYITGGSSRTTSDEVAEQRNSSI